MHLLVFWKWPSTQHGDDSNKNLGNGKGAACKRRLGWCLGLLCTWSHCVYRSYQCCWLVDAGHSNLWAHGGAPSLWVGIPHADLCQGADANEKQRGDVVGHQVLKKHFENQLTTWEFPGKAWRCYHGMGPTSTAYHPCWVWQVWKRLPDAEVTKGIGKVPFPSVIKGTCKNLIENLLKKLGERSWAFGWYLNASIFSYFVKILFEFEKPGVARFLATHDVRVVDPEAGLWHLIWSTLIHKELTLALVLVNWRLWERSIYQDPKGCFFSTYQTNQKALFWT